MLTHRKHFSSFHTMTHCRIRRPRETAGAGAGRIQSALWSPGRGGLLPCGCATAAEPQGLRKHGAEVAVPPLGPLQRDTSRFPVTQ